MARPKKTPDVTENVSDVVENDTDKNFKTFNKDVDDVFKVIDKMNPDAVYLNENALSNVTSWIDTGSYALNAIISGSLFKGVPVGRITGFYGPQATGKTTILTKIMSNALKAGFRPIYFDTESALDTSMAQNFGCDVSKIKHVPIETVEDLKNQLLAFLSKLIEKNLKKRACVFIDSIGNLSTKKEFTDAENEHNAQDMGLKAKLVSSLLRNITYKCAKAEVPVVFVNHVYEDPGAFTKSMIKKQPGGLKPLFISSVLVQLSGSMDKVDDSKGETSVLSSKVAGTYLRAFTTKNRFVPPFIETSIYLNYKTGLNKYSGLVDLAEKYNILTKSGHSYVCNGEILGGFNDLENNVNFWDTIGLNLLEEKLKQDLTFSTEKPIIHES